MIHNRCLAFVLLALVSRILCAASPPNIVFVLADDLGWAELGCYGNDFNEMPNLDRLAKQGMRFTGAYAAAPVCSPYRAALLTGQHPARIGITDYLRPNSANALSTSLITLPELLQSSGYSTGKIGKWHLTGYDYHGAEHEVKPSDHGFAWDFGGEVKGVGNGANFWPNVFREQEISWLDIQKRRLGENEYLTDRLNLEAVDFIQRNKDKPFFLYLSHYAPHTILNGKPDLVQKYVRKHKPGKSTRDRCYLCEDDGLGAGDPNHHWAGDHNPHLAAMIESIDDGMGLIAAKLDELGLTDSTILIFTSDNGGETNVTSNAPLRGGKSQLYEGGIRVPLIIRWPNTIPAGSVNDQPTQNVDFYPTLLSAAGIAHDQNQPMDGVSTLATWKNPDQSIDRDFLAWHYPLDKPHFLGGKSGGAIRSAEWKMIEYFDSGKAELYSLDADPSEELDLAETEPAVVARLRKQLADWRTKLGARLPSPPLLTEPRQLYFADHFNPNQLSRRLWYNADWKADGGILRRLPNGSGNTRVFLRDATYQDVVIRFDFRLGKAKDVRLMTGNDGHYNTVLHLRPDHFFLQTAQNKSIPHFSYRHSECAFEFDPERWYTMTVEFLGNEAVAHLDHQHLVYAKHPIIDDTRDYFALQVDKHTAEFDNVQILSAVPSNSNNGRAKIESGTNRFPVNKSLQEQIAIRKSNAHEWYFQRDATYRQLVQKVDELDDARKQRFPDAFRSHKDFRAKIQKERAALLETDPTYKDQLFATHRANRAIDQWLIAKRPGLEGLSVDRRKAFIAELRRKHATAPELIRLIDAANQAQTRLEVSYPELFITDDEISEKKKAAADRLRHDEAFKQLSNARADAYRAQQTYLMTIDKELMQLSQKLDSPN